MSKEKAIKYLDYAKEFVSSIKTERSIDDIFSYRDACIININKALKELED